MKNIIRNLNEKVKKIIALRKEPKISLILKITTLLLLFLWLYNLSTIRFRQQHLNLKVGDVAPYDITVANDVEYVDEQATQKKIENVISRISPQFKLRLDIAKDKKDNVDYIFDEIDKLTKENKPPEEIAKIIIKQIKIEKDALMVIIKFNSLNNFRYKVKNLLDYIYKIGVTSITKDDIKKLSNTGYIIKIYSSENNEEISVRSSIDDIFYYDNISIKEVVKKIYPTLRWDKTDALSKVLKFFITPNLFYSRLRTEEKIKDEIKMAESVKKRLKKGQVIVRYGEEITESQFKKISELKKYSRESHLPLMRGYLIIFLLFFIISSILLLSYGKKWLNKNKYFLFLVSFVFMSCTLNYFFPRLSRFFPVRLENSYFIPMGGIAVLIASFSNYTLSYIVTLFISIITTFLIGSSFMDFVIMFLVGSSTIYFSNKPHKKISNWYVALFISFLYFLIILAISQINNYSNSQFWNGVLIGVLNGFISIILSTGLMPLFEYIFNLLTVNRLYELSDLNSPIMKRLLVEAPGTYHHSVLVANLAESAALNIGANSLLARVGGYYHDIGKIENPDYFIENQSDKESKHDKIKPSISSSIIKSHLKYGVEMAKKLRLPSEIIDIILQHHGTTVISFFYKKALETAEKTDKANLIENYRYGGPKPQSKEAAVVMLADSIEAASRALKNPSHSRIVGLVSDIINTRLLEGELDESDLTFKDLNKISQSFIQVLSGIYHSRIEYPEKEEIKKLEKD